MRRLEAFVALVAVLLPAAAAAGEARLLVPPAPRGQEADREIPGSIGVMRARTVAVNLAALPGADGVSALPPPGHTVRLDLFDDVSLLARMERAERLAKGMAWVGRLDGQPMSSVVLVVWDGILSGSMTWPDGAYRIRFDGTNAVVEQLDESQFPEDHILQEAPAVAAAVPPATAADAIPVADDGSLIDVLVVYTPAARATAGGTSAMLSLINQGVTETNLGYANSGVVQRIRLVGTAEVSYTESGTTANDMLTDLKRVTATSDGYIDNVHTLRNTYGADVVSFWETGYNNVNGACGIAWLMAGNNPGFASNAFSVVDISCATGYYSFGHEMGHNMGLNHARVDPVGTGAYFYSFGYKDPGNAFRTVMAYNCSVNCTRILNFSNPNVLHASKPTGIACTDPSCVTPDSTSAYNALSLNNTRVTVANWRATNAAQVAVVSPNGGESWLAGSVHAISWTSANLDATSTIRLSYTNGTTTYTIASGLSRSSTSYNWTTPATAGSNWKVTVCSDVGGGLCEAQDTSDAAFSITLPPTVGLVSPNGGEAWPVGSIQIITWSAANLSPGATIKLSYTNGTTTSTIATGLPPTSGSYDWTIPNNQASNWKVTVCSDVSGSCEVQDSSDASFSITATASPPANRDFNGDGHADILWHHQTTGGLYAWFLGGANGVVTQSGSYLTPSSFSDTRWQIRGIADFNHDGRNDILWHHQTTGDLYVWFLGGTNGVVALSGGYLDPKSFSDTRWQIRGIADFDGDGNMDILWHHQTTGDLYVWFLNGLTVTRGSYLTPKSFTDTQWQIRGIADFNHDGKADILWHHQTTGDLYVWFLGGTNGVVTQSGSYLTPRSFSDTLWKIVELADFDGDGNVDLLWHHQGNGSLYVWFLGGTNGVVTQGGSYLTPSAFSDTNWKVVPR